MRRKRGNPGVKNQFWISTEFWAQSWGELIANRLRSGKCNLHLFSNSLKDERSWISLFCHFVFVLFYLSCSVTQILETIIRYYEEEQGEALLEFLYAIAIKKLSLKKDHLSRVLELLNEKCKGEIFVGFSKFIEENIYKEKAPTSLKSSKRKKWSKLCESKNE